MDETSVTMRAATGRMGAGAGSHPRPAVDQTTSGMISNATMLMILISGLMAGPAVSL